MDRNSYYGGESASLTLDQARVHCPCLSLGMCKAAPAILTRNGLRFGSGLLLARAFQMIWAGRQSTMWTSFQSS